MHTSQKLLDKFYTKEDISETFCDVISRYVDSGSVIIEPSAGGGSFIEPIKKRWGSYSFLDIAPEHVDVMMADFLTSSFQRGFVFIGNPPFGKNSSLAVKFFNHAASFEPKAICMIHPKTFMKPRFWDRLNSSYSIVHQYELPDNSFTFCSASYNVPCVAQIWMRKERPFILPTDLTLFGIGCCEENILIRRAGASAGKIVDQFTPSSTYKTNCSADTKHRLVDMYPEIRRLASLTAGVRSITLLEIEDILLGRYSVP